MNILDKSDKTLNEKGNGLGFDSSLVSLIISNLAVTAWAVVDSWSLPAIMWVYWLQSVSIGFFWFFKILMLKDFSTKNFRIGRSVLPTTRTKIHTAVFFLAHYGFFHLAYAAGIGKLNQTDRAIAVIAAGTVFFLNQFYSFVYNQKQLPQQQKPNIGKFMLYPYLRIIPMHFTIMAASMLHDKFGLKSQSKFILLIFLLLKTVADVAMYVQCKKGFADKPARPVHHQPEQIVKEAL
jgi:hypothetical protein